MLSRPVLLSCTPPRLFILWLSTVACGGKVLVKVEKRSGETLGLEYSSLKHCYTPKRELANKTLGRWIEEHPMQHLEAGDCLVRVNGVTWDARHEQELFRTVQRGGSLELEFQTEPLGVPMPDPTGGAVEADSGRHWLAAELSKVLDRNDLDPFIPLYALSYWLFFGLLVVLWRGIRRFRAEDFLEDVEDGYLREGNLGARRPPSTCALWFCPACAISGYEEGNPTAGLFHGDARVACLLNTFCCCLGSIFAVFCWRPDPAKIRGDGRQRTVGRWSPWLVGSCCSISFWESGDLCRGLCRGDAANMFILNLNPLFSGAGLGLWYAACLWRPKSRYFRRDTFMHGGESKSTAEVVGQSCDKLIGTGSRVQKNFIVMPNMIIDREHAVGKFKGTDNLGVKSTTEECLAALHALNDPIAAVWHCDGDRTLRIGNISEMVTQGPIQYTNGAGVVSFQKKWRTLPNKHLDFSVGPLGNYKGTLGQAWSLEECIDVLQSCSDVSYAVWRKDKDNTLHIFDTSARISHCRMRYYNFRGVVSFEASAVNCGV